MLITQLLQISPLMLPLGLCALISIAIVCERIWILRMAVLAPQSQREKIKQAITDPQALALLKENRQANMLQQLVVAAIESYEGGIVAVRNAIKFEGEIITHELYRFLSLLGAVVMIAPLLGLLGTVLGLMEVFTAMLRPDAWDQQTPQLNYGISQALSTTAVGLIVAIPGAFCHRLLQRRVNSLVIALEKECMNTIRDFPPLR